MKDYIHRQLKEISHAIKDLAGRVKKLEVQEWTGDITTIVTNIITNIIGEGDLVEEGPGIDIVATGTGARVGFGKDTILLVHNNGLPADEFSFDQIGLIAALATSVPGEQVRIDAEGSVTGDFTIPDSVTLKSLDRKKTSIIGRITFGNLSVLDEISVPYVANESGYVSALVAPLTGVAEVHNCDINVDQQGAGNAAIVDIQGSGSIHFFTSNLDVQVTTGDGFLAVRDFGQTGVIRLWDCQVNAGGSQEYQLTGAGWLWEAPGISASIVKPPFGVGSGWSAWSSIYNPPSDAQAFVYRHLRTGDNTNEWSSVETSPNGGSTPIPVNTDQFNRDKYLYFRKNGYHPDTDSQVLAKYSGAIWKNNDDSAVLGPNQVVRAGWGSGFGIPETYTVTGYMLDVLRFIEEDFYNWSDPLNPFVFVYSVQGGYDGVIDSFEPMTGEAGAWNTEDYPTRHGRDIYENFVAVDQYHNDPNDPFAKSSAGHPAVTLAADADTLLGLSTQQITLDSQDANEIFAGPVSGGAVDPTFRAMVNADLPNPLALLASSILTISVGVVTVSKSYHIIAAETGITDDLATINGGTARQFLMLQADTGDTITVKHGTGNIFLNGSADFTLSGDKTLLLFYDGTNWADVGAGGGGGGGHEILEDGVSLTQRSKLNFLGFDLADDAGNNETEVSLPTGIGNAVTATKKTLQTRTVLYDDTLLADGSWDVQNIDQNYDHLEIILHGNLNDASSSNYVNIAFNNDTTLANYRNTRHYAYDGSHAISGSDNRLMGILPGNNAFSNSAGSVIAQILNYAKTAFNKQLSSISVLRSDAIEQEAVWNMGLDWESTSAINRIEISAFSGSIKIGSRLQIVGIKEEEVVTNVVGGGDSTFIQEKKSIQTRTVLHDSTLVSAGSFDVSSLPQDYDHLEILLQGNSDQATPVQGISIDLNNDATLTNYQRTYHYAVGAIHNIGTVDDKTLGIVPGTTAPTNSIGEIKAEIHYYAGSKKKQIFAKSSMRGSDATGEYLWTENIEWENTSAINRIEIAATAGNLVAGTRLQIIGIKEEEVVTNITGAGELATEAFVGTVLHDETLAIAGSFDVSNIPQGYDSLELILVGESDQATTTQNVRLTLNNDTTDANYRRTYHFADGDGSHEVGGGDDRVISNVPGTTAPSNSTGFLKVEIPHYTRSKNKQIFTQSLWRSTATLEYIYQINVDWENTAAINRIALAPTTGNFAIGSRLQIIGYKNQTIGGGNAIPLAGWEEAGETWTYASADDPTYTLTISEDVTGKYSVGMRVRLSQVTGGTKYFIITKVSYSAPDTTLTLYGGTDYDLANETISSPYYSVVKSPYGFPLDPLKWSIETNRSSDDAQISPVTNTWYNPGPVTIIVPIGAWKVNYQCAAFNTNTGATTFLRGQVTLSTANNSESDSDFTSWQGQSGASAAQTNISTLNREKFLNLTTKTTYYLNIRTTQPATTIQFAGSQSKTIIRVVCAYL